MKSIIIAFVGLIATGAPPVNGNERESLIAPAGDSEIAAFIQDLGHPQYETRTYATRRLCAIGLAARDELLAAGKGGEAEVALRAQRILAVLDRQWFAGVEVRLTFSKREAVWDEPVDLRVSLANRSQYPARVPFDLDPAARAMASDDARQVGDMLDVADFLRVRDTQGERVELRVDDIAADPAVVAAVQDRLNGGPSFVLDAGAETTFTVTAFNRGWARYPLLDSGEYTVTLDYVPDWEDNVLLAERVGRVASAPARITITGGAPQTVSRAGAEASVAIALDGKTIAASITNQTDQPILINKNFGVSPPFARAFWIYQHQTARFEVPVAVNPGASWHDFDPALLVEVQPGGTAELARIAIADLRGAFADLAADVENSDWTVRFDYANLCDRHWQRRQGSALLGNPNAPIIFQEPLPRRILAARHSSAALTAPKAD